MRITGIIISSLFISLFFNLVSAQMADVVDWSASYDEASNCINIKADMKDDWVIYSQHTDPEGPIPLEFDFATTDEIALEGKVIEISDPIKMMSEMFGVEVIKFKDDAEFQQKLKEKPTSGTLNINVTYMTCDSKRCLPPTTVPLEVRF